MKTRYILIGLVAAGSLAMAGHVTIPHQFEGGKKAMALEVNANFDAVKNAVNDNDGRIGVNERNITSNATAVKNNRDAIDNKLTKNIGNCASGSYIRKVNIDGTVVCETDTDTTYTAAGGITLDGTTIKRADGAVSVHFSAFVEGKDGCKLERVIYGYFRFSSSSTQADCFANAPVSLPDQSVIDGFKCYVIKNDGGTDSLSVKLMAREHTKYYDQYQQDVAGESISTSSSDVVEIDASANASIAEVKNDTYSYFLYYDPPNNTNTSNGAKNSLLSCYIEYHFE